MPEPIETPPPLSEAGFRCTACGYDLTGATVGGTCPECGTRIDISMYAASKPTSGMAIASMVLGIVSVVSSTVGLCCTGPVVGLPCGILALVFWKLATGPIERGEVSSGSRGINRTGLITGIIGVVFGLAFAAFVAYAIITDM